MRIPLRGDWVAAFVLLSLVCLGAHELVHHVTARATCGANLPLARFVTVLMRGGDEMVLGRAWIGGDAAWPVLFTITVLLLVAPVVACWRAIRNPGKSLLFAALLIVPLFIDVVIKRVLLARVLEAWPASVAGIPLLFLGVMVGALGALAWLLRRDALTDALPGPERPLAEPGPGHALV